MVAGVAAGLGDHFGISTPLLRLAFIILAFMGGVGVVLYLLGWLLIPEAGSARSIAESAIEGGDDTNSWTPIVLISLAAFVVLGSLDVVDSSLILAAVLFGVGFLFYRSQGSSETAEPEVHVDRPSVAEPPASTSYLDAARAEIDEIEGPLLDDPVYSYFEEPPQRVTVRAESRRSSYLGRLTLAFALFAVGVMTLLDTIGIFNPGLSDYLAAVLGVIGVGLLIGAVVGRARWLILPGLLLLPLVLVASLIKVPLGASYGEFNFTPTTPSDLMTDYDFGGADVRFDLRELQNLTEDQTITVEMGAGQLQIIVPADLNFVLDADLAAGEIDINAGNANAQQLRGTEDQAGLFVEQRFEQTSGSGPVVEMQVDVAFGSIELVVAES